MVRKVHLILGLLAVAAAAGEARAQFGYGSYGWGGWGGGGTVQGGIARGLGYYDIGLGQLEVSDAQARSINTDTVERWNQYWWDAQLTANRNERLRMARREKRDAQSGEYLYEQLRGHPSPADIADGNALDAILEQLGDPRVHSSALRLATDKVPAKLIKALPFVHASEAATFCLDQLTAEKGWPFALRGERFADERKAYTEAIDKALKEDTEGDLTPETLRNVRTALGRLRAKFEANPPTDRGEYTEAENYLKTLIGMTRMLDRPDIEKAIAELDKMESTSLGKLLAFMQAYNLRFGRATTPEQRNAYTSLYPILSAHRDRVMKAVQSDTNATARADRKNANANGDRPPTDFLSGARLNAFDNPPASPQPAPPQPAPPDRRDPGK